MLRQTDIISEMAEKEVVADVDTRSSANTDDNGLDQKEVIDVKHHNEEEIAQSGNWYDRRLVKFLPPYSNSMCQIVMLSFVVFMTPGMYNALTGIGGSGIDTTVADNANVALYSTFATIGFFGGTICNLIGVRLCLILGGTGYLLYAGSLLCYTHTSNSGFVIFAGAYLGACAACLWAAQGTIIMSYPTEEKKGRAILVFWIIFNFGAVIGSIIPLADNLQNKTAMANDSTYIAFIVLMGCGSIIALLMLPMSKVWKSDGTKVISQKHPYWKDELIGLYKLLISDRKVILLFPMFFASNWFYTYQFNDFNAGRFNLRTRSLNSLLYWLFQMVGSLFLGSILDLKYFRRSVRSRIGFVILFVFAMVIWGGGLKFQLQFNRTNTNPKSPGHLEPMDYKDGAYIGPMFLYIFYGIFDAMFQTYCLWILGSMSNNPKKTSLYAGFYKGLQSAGAGIVWRLDALAKPYMTLFASSWGLVGGTLLIAIPVVWFKITDHTDAVTDGLPEILNSDELQMIASANGEEEHQTEQTDSYNKV